MFVSWKHFWILCVLRILWVYSSYDLMILKYCLSQCGLIGSCVIRWALPTRRTIVKSTWHRHFSAVCHRHLSAMSPALSRLHKKLSEQVPIPTKRFFCKHRIWCIVVASWRFSWSLTCTRTYCFSFAVWRWPLKLAIWVHVETVWSQACQAGVQMTPELTPEESAWARTTTEEQQHWKANQVWMEEFGVDLGEVQIAVRAYSVDLRVFRL